MTWNGDGDSATDRRKFLKVVGAASMVGLAGCGGDGGDGGGDGSDGDDGGGSDGGDGDDGGGSDGSDGDGGGSDGGDGDDGGMSVDWTMGTSGPETATHASGVAMSEVISEKSDSISMSAQTTGGTAANPRLIAQGDIDVAQSTDWAVARSNSGADPYGEPVGKTMTQVLPFMTLEYYLVKREGELEGVETVSDIPQDGSVSMAFGQRGGTNFFAGLDGFQLSGIDNVQDTYDLQSMSWGDQGSQFADGRLDVMLVYGVSREVLTGWAQEAGAQVDVSVVEWEFSEDAIANSDLPYTYIETPADLWDGQEIRMDSVPAVGVGYQTIFPADVSEDLGYEFVSTVMDDIDAVREASSVLARAGPDFAQEFLLPSGNAPVHPGAERYYKEQDLWKDGLTTLDEYEG
jgi:TRAP transporter TAXI family solute receptor